MSRVIIVQVEPWNAVQTKKEDNLFERMKAVTEDQEWRRLFDEASKGNFRQGFRFANGFLMFSEKGKPKTKKVFLPDDPIKAAKMCQEFMRENGGVRTEIEMRKSQELLKTTTKVTNWDKIKKSEPAKNFHLLRFTHRLSDSLGLSITERKELHYKLLQLIRSKGFDHKRVVFEEGRIVEIKNLKVNGGQLIDEPIPEHHYSPIVCNTTESNGIDYRTRWTRYINRSTHRSELNVSTELTRSSDDS